MRRQLALIPNHPITPSPVMHVVPPTPSLNIVYIFSPKPKGLPTPPWFIDNLEEDFPPNPTNSPIHFPMEILRLTTIFNPQNLDIWYMPSEPSQPPCDIPSIFSLPEYNHTVTVTNITPLDPLYSQQFHCDEEILEELTTPDCLWDPLHYQALFIS
jgi:hypothetical protein